MNILIVTDIFGINESTQFIVDSLSSLGQVKVFDPYEGKAMNLDDEQQAYRYFTSLGGVNFYADKLMAYLTRFEPVDYAIGFSVGGSAFWHVSSVMKTPLITRQLCFYPNQVRHMTHLDPQCPTQIILPQSEQHFCVKTLASQIIEKPRVQVDFVEQLHGFMNESSQHFDATARIHHLEQVKRAVST